MTKTYDKINFKSYYEYVKKIDQYISLKIY